MHVCCPFGKNCFCYLPSQRDEVERLQGEVDRHNLDFIRASHTSDGSITDSEMPGVSASFAEKVCWK